MKILNFLQNFYKFYLAEAERDDTSRLSLDSALDEMKIADIIRV